jgi:glucose-1-phosphate cytidylyltransferase
MKAVILCGGKGTRLAEETKIVPKPLVNVGNFPIVWHIMNIYAQFGVDEFVLALGYKGDVIKDYFMNYFSRSSDFSIDLETGSVDYHSNGSKKWKIHLVDTGAETMTGGRLLRLKDFLKDDESFHLTYGDGVSNVNIAKLTEFHKEHRKIASVTAVRPAARFGEMILDNAIVTSFAEKPQATVGWINGGFFMFNKEIFNYLKSDETILERDPMEGLVTDSQLNSFKHEGFWQCMDTLRDKEYLNGLVDQEEIPWLTFKD